MALTFIINEWSTLPNAKLIDWVLADAEANSDIWSTTRNISQSEGYSVACRSAGDVAMSIPDRYVVYIATLRAVYNLVRGMAQEQVRGVLTSLVAYDDCAKYLEMTPDELQVWGELSGDPACVLMLPMVIRLKSQNLTINPKSAIIYT